METKDPEVLTVTLNDADILKVAAAAFATSLLACLLAIWFTRTR